jgi:hypothetical protein
MSPQHHAIDKWSKKAHDDVGESSSKCNKPCQCLHYLQHHVSPPQDDEEEEAFVIHSLIETHPRELIDYLKIEISTIISC